MSIPLQLHFRTLGLQMEATLKSEALPELLALIQRFRSEESLAGREGPSAYARGAGFRPVSAEMMRRKMPSGHEPTVMGGEAEVAVSGFRSLSWEALTVLLPDKKFATKILLLTAWLEAQAGHSVFKGEVRAHFARTGEPFPANPGRDTRTLILDGLIAKSSDRQHWSLSEAGWKEVLRYLDAGDGTAALV